MPNIRLDLAGATYGCLRVLRWDESSYGSHNSSWVCECQNCGAVVSIRGQSLRKSPKSCTNCKMMYREYPNHELSCSECSNKFTHNTKVKSGQCSEVCKSKALSRRMMTERRTDLDGMMHSLLVQIKSRAKRRGLEFNLDVEWARGKLKDQDGRCARTGRELAPSTKGVSPIAAATLSFDRVDPSKGYVKDNTEIVCYAYNVGKHKLSTQEFEAMCKDVLQKSGYVVLDKEAP